VSNQIFEARDTNLVYALSRMARDFLGLEAPVLGSLRASWRIHDSVNAGRPYLLHPGVDGDECAAAFRTIARTLRTATLPAPRPARDAHAAPRPRPAPAVPCALPVDVAEYQRAYQRYLVDLPAALTIPGGALPARLKDVSAGGALVELDDPPIVGTKVTLLVPAMGDQFGLACGVRHRDPRKRRAGLQFLGERTEGARLAEALRALGAARG